MALINSEGINVLLNHCLVKDSDHIDGKRLLDEEVIIVKGIVNTFVFHKERLNSVKNEIITLVNNLPHEVNEGISFLNMCVDKNDNLWGQQPDCEKLLCLAIGVDVMAYLLPEEAWSFLPGGVPFIIAKNNKGE